MYWLISNQFPDIQMAYRKINNPANHDVKDVHFWDGEWYIRDPDNDTINPNPVKESEEGD